MIRRGEIGEPRLFTSVFSFPVAPATTASRRSIGAGRCRTSASIASTPCATSSRSEPTEVIAATAARPGDARFSEVEEMVSATLRFPGDRFAHFIASFGGDDIDQYRVVGTTGQIEVSSGYRFDRPITLKLTKGGKTVEKAFPQYDHFSGQAHYFSDCILNGARPEPDGGDGLADVAIMRAIEEAAKTGQAQKIALPERPSHPVKAMARSSRWRRSG